MKTENIHSLLQDLTPLTDKEVIDICGGGFAYDAGFFVRELFVYMANGMGTSGAVAAAVDAGTHYKPVN